MRGRDVVRKQKVLVAWGDIGIGLVHAQGLVIRIGIRIPIPNKSILLPHLSTATWIGPRGKRFPVPIECRSGDY
jgi:hypothetical protein